MQLHRSTVVMPRVRHEPIPGAREPGGLTRFNEPEAPYTPDGVSTLDAPTTAERRKEGGGAAAYR